MGKCKRRTLNKSMLEAPLTREAAVQYIVRQVKLNDFDEKAKNLLTLFGITPEELTESGISYEEILILKRFM